MWTMFLNVLGVSIVEVGIYGRIFDCQREREGDQAEGGELARAAIFWAAEGQVVVDDEGVGGGLGA